MREQDIILLARFVKREHTLAGSELQTSITSFIAGYEIGTDLKCDFTEILSNELEQKHGIERSASGWPQQVEVYSKRENQSWIEAFQTLTLTILEKEINRLG